MATTALAHQYADVVAAEVRDSKVRLAVPVEVARRHAEGLSADSRGSGRQEQSGLVRRGETRRSNVGGSRRRNGSQGEKHPKQEVRDTVFQDMQVHGMRPFCSVVLPLNREVEDPPLIGGSSRSLLGVFAGPS